MRYFVISMLVMLVAGLSITIPYQVLSGTNSADVKTVTVRDKTPIVANVSEEVVDANTLTIKELNTKDAVIIQFNTEVVKETVDVAIEKIKLANKQKKKKAIYLLINSPGGSVFNGARLITAMDNSKIPVYTVCTEGCYSMGAQILEHGKERYAVDRATIMFHPASTAMMVEGEVDKIFSRINHAKQFIDKFDAYNAKRSGTSYEQFKSKVSREYWLDSEDALSAHLIDAIVSIDFEDEKPVNPTIQNNLKLELKD